MSENRKFEDMLAELEAIVEKMEKGDQTLDESMEMFEKGMALSKQLNKTLDTIEKKISIIIEGQDGTIEEQPFSEQFSASGKEA